MKDGLVASAAFVFGWLMSKTWQDPGCQLGLTIFLVLSAIMALTFALAVVGHGRQAPAPPDDTDEDTRL